MARKGSYKFTDKTHAVKGMISTILGISSILIFVILVYISYRNKGNAGVYLGVFGIAGMGLSLEGLVLGIMSFQEKEVYYLFSKIGTIMNSVLLIIWISIYGMGL